MTTIGLTFPEPKKGKGSKGDKKPAAGQTPEENKEE